MLKKLSSILVALALVVTLIPATVAADTTNLLNKIDSEKQSTMDLDDVKAALEDALKGADKVDFDKSILKSAKTLLTDVGDDVWYENESNDSADLADYIDNDYTIIGSIDEYDLDYFGFDLYSTSTVRVLLQSKSPATLTGFMDYWTEEFVAVTNYENYEDGYYYYGITCELPAGEYLYVVFDSEYNNYDYMFYFAYESTGGYESDVWRIAGQTRYDTAFKTAEELLCYMEDEKFSNVIIADGTNFPDALAGSYLACEMNAPILLTDSSAGNVSRLKSFINTNLEPGGTIYVLGGPGAVGDNAVSGMQRNYDVVRLAGSNRYSTNMEVLNEAGINGDDILICTGAGYADSLSVSSLDLPILLVGDTLTPEQESFIASNRNKQFWLIGGPGAVSTAIENEIYECGARWVDRVAGSNRYATSAAVAETFAGDPYQAVLAYGMNFPDGLAGGPLAYTINAPLLLTANGSTAFAEDYVSMSNIYGGYILGGPSLISDASARDIFMLPYNAIINLI